MFLGNNSNSRLEELQELVLNKIKSHTTQQHNATEHFLISLSHCFKKLSFQRQLRLQRMFLELLEKEHEEQELENSQNY